MVEKIKRSIDWLLIAFLVPILGAALVTMSSFTGDSHFFERQLKIEIPIEDVKKGLSDAAKKKNISLTEPSYGDIIGTMILNHEDEILGTTCIGTDIEPEKIECWSTKDRITKGDFDKAVEELGSPAINSNPLKWVRPLFNKETIDLNKDL